MQDQPRVVVSEEERTQADRSLNHDNRLNVPDGVNLIEGQQVQKPVDREPTDAIAGPSTQPIDALPELETDIVSETLMMTGIVPLINADNDTLEKLLGQQSNVFEEDHILNIELRQPCESRPAMSSSS